MSFINNSQPSHYYLVFHFLSLFIVLLAAKRTKSPGTEQNQSLVPPARELPRQHNSFVQACHYYPICRLTGAAELVAHGYTEKVIPVLRSDSPRTMGAKRQGFPL